MTSWVTSKKTPILLNKIHNINFRNPPPSDPPRSLRLSPPMWSWRVTSCWVSMSTCSALARKTQRSSMSSRKRTSQRCLTPRRRRARVRCGHSLDSRREGSVRKHNRWRLSRYRTTIGARKGCSKRRRRNSLHRTYSVLSRRRWRLRLVLFLHYLDLKNKSQLLSRNPARQYSMINLCLH